MIHWLSSFFAPWLNPVCAIVCHWNKQTMLGISIVHTHTHTHSVLHNPSRDKKDLHMEETVSHECSRTGHVCMWSTKRAKVRKVCFATQDSQARTPQSLWLYSSAAWAWGWEKSCSFPLLWLRSLPLSHRRTWREPQSINVKSCECKCWQDRGAGLHHMGVKLGLTYLRRPSKWAGVPGTMVLMKKGCWPWLSS